MSTRWTALVCTATLAASMPSLALAQDVFDDDGPTGTALTANELEGTGRTMEAGKHLVSVMGRYRYGVTDWFQVGTTGIEWILMGPSLNVGFTPYADDRHSISLELDGNAAYSFGTLVSSANLIYSLGDATGSRFNGGVAFSWQKIDAEVEITFDDPLAPKLDPVDVSGTLVGIPLHLGYDLAINDVQMVRFWFNPYLVYSAESDSDAFDPPPFAFNGGIAYYRGYDRFRLAAGATVTNLGLDNLRALEELALDAERDPIAVPDVLPLPFVRLYWLL